MEEKKGAINHDHFDAGFLFLFISCRRRRRSRSHLLIRPMLHLIDKHDSDYY